MDGTTRLILYAPNTEQVDLIAVAVVRVLEAVVHAPAVSEATIVLRGTPPVATAADNVETATWIAVAARQGGKAISVLTIAAAVPTFSRF